MAKLHTQSITISASVMTKDTVQDLVLITPELAEQLEEVLQSLLADKLADQTPSGTVLVETTINE